MQMTATSGLMMAKYFRAVILMACILSARSALAAGGTCPSGANYINTSNGSPTTLSALGVTNCYYIAANGSDSNDGLSEASPWQHAPGMKNCASNCGSVSVTAGEGFIFRGGDTWHFGNSSASPYAGVVAGCDGNGTQSGGLCLSGFNGSSSHPFYYGVDPTWYSGSSWTRPILTGDNPLTPHPGTFGDYVASCTYQIGGTNRIVVETVSTYAILDGFELTGLCSNSDNGSNDIYVRGNGATSSSNNSYERLYAHGWTHIQFSGSYNANLIVFAGCNNLCGTDSYLFNVVDGSDSDPGGLGWVAYTGASTWAYNVFRYCSNFVVTEMHVLHDNLFENWYGEADEAHHPNVYEENNEGNSTNAVYNNVFYDICQGNNCPLGIVNMWPNPQVGFTTYWFNNVNANDNPGGNYFDIGQNSNMGDQGTLVIFNNTLENTSGNAIMTCDGSGFAEPFWFVNNHYITDASSQYLSYCATSSSPHFVTDATLQSHAQADADSSPHFDKYNGSQTYAFSPVASTNTTVGVGTNEIGYCNTLSGSSDPLLQAAGAACVRDTTYACGYNLSSHTVSCPARTTVARPASGAWDVGAYQYSSTQSSAPNPPTNLSATVQ
jgi:hypothetical protein